MGKALLAWHNNYSEQDTGSPRYTSIGGGTNNFTATESEVKFKTKLAGTLSNLNTYTDNIGTGRNLRTRVNGANGNLTVSPTNTTAGYWADNSNTDTVAVDDTLDFQFTRSTGSPLWYWATCAFAAGDVHATHYVASSTAGAGLTFSTASSTRYLALSGASSLSSTEASKALKIRAGTSAKFLHILINSNARSTDTVYTLRINNTSVTSDGNCTVTVPAGQTGYFISDSSLNDTLGDGYTIGVRMVTGSGTGSIGMSLIGVTVLNATESKSDVCAQASRSRAASATTNYFTPLGGFSQLTTITNETGVGFKTGFACKIDRFRCRVAGNTCSASVTVALRVNGVDVSTLTIASGVTNSWVEDTTTAQVTIAATDAISCSIVGGSTGTCDFESFIFRLDSGVASRTLTAETGTYTLTGQTATFTKAGLLAAASGAFTFTGKTASLVRPGVLQANTGIFTLTGQTATFTKAGKLLAGTGTFTLTGQNASFATALQRIVLPVGTTSWTPPTSWNSASNTIRIFGQGGDGGDGTSFNTGTGGSGGGGRAYSHEVNVPLVAGSPCEARVPGHGTGLSAYLKSNITGNIVVSAGPAQNGTNASSQINVAGGLGGQASAGIGSVRFSGGTGGAGFSGCGAGGGGDAGPDGIGRAGGANIQGGTGHGGGNGGGCDGLLSTVGDRGSLGPSDPRFAGDGPTNVQGLRSSIATGVPGPDGPENSGCGGAGGFVNGATPNVSSSGGSGALFPIWTISSVAYGPYGGGAGGGGHQNSGNGASRGGNGGEGGGGGGGGGAGVTDPLDSGTPVPGQGGNGKDAVIIIEWAPLDSVTARTLDAGTGFFTLTGGAANFPNVRLPADTGYFVLSGQDATFRARSAPDVSSGSRLLLTTPARRAGRIDDILFTPSTPIISRLDDADTVVIELFAKNASGTVTYTDELANTKFTVTDNQVTLNDGSLLTPGNAEMLRIKAVDSRGASFSFAKDITVNVYTVPTEVSLGTALGASGQTGTIVFDDPAGTQVGTFIPTGGKPPHSYTNVNTKFEIGLDGSGFKSLIRSSTGALVDGVPEDDTITVTDALGETFDQDITITVTDVAASAPSRFNALDDSTWPVVALEFMLGDPTVAPTVAQFDPDVRSSGVICCKEGQVGSWKAHTSHVPYAAINLQLFSTRDDVRRFCTLHGLYPVKIKYWVSGSVYTGPYYFSSYSIEQDNGGAVETISFDGTGTIDMGTGPSGVTLHRPPYMQMRPANSGSQNTGASLDTTNGTNNGESSWRPSSYRLSNYRWGPFREEEAAAVVKAFNVASTTAEATTAAECIYPAKPQQGNGIALIDSILQLSVVNCEVAGSVASGMHASTHLNGTLYNAQVQVIDTLFYGNGSGNNDHNSYIGHVRHNVFRHSKSTNAVGHCLKYDKNVRIEIAENSISGDDGVHTTWQRTTNPKIFTGTTGALRAALRTIPASPPYTIDIYSWISDVDDLTVPAVPVTLVPTFAATGTPITVLTVGSPAAGQTVRTIAGAATSSKTSNTAVATFTFNAADAGKQVRIPGKGLGIARNNTQGACISIDNPNQDMAIWNNMFHPLHYSASVASAIYIQGRHGGADMGHPKHPPYSRQNRSFGEIRQWESVLSGTSGEFVVPPKTLTGYVGVALGGLAYRLYEVDYPYPECTTRSADTGFPTLATDGTVYAIDIRHNDGTKTTTTCTVTALNSSTKSRWDILLTSAITGSVSYTSSNSISMWPNATGPDRLRMDDPLQRGWFDRSYEFYWPYTTTFESNRAELDFSKQENGDAKSIPFGYAYNNFTIPLIGSDITGSVSLRTAVILWSLNATWSTKRFSNGANYEIRPPFPPLKSSNGVAWPDDPQAGAFDWRVHANQPVYGTDGTGGVGIKGSDMIRPNAIVMKENFIFDYHMPAAGKYEGYGKVGDGAVVESLYNTDDMLPDIRFIAQNLPATVDLNGCIRLTVADKARFPAAVDRGKPFKCLTGINVGDTNVDRCQIQTLAGGTPAVDDAIVLEVDTQWGVGEGVHNAYITTVTPVNATTFDIIFAPGLPQPGDADPIEGTVALGHEKGLSVFTAADEWGGRGAFGKPADTPLPPWWLDPTDIPD